MAPILHVTIFIMFDWKSLLLLIHILISLRILWKAFYKSTFLSPIVWKISCICNISLVFFVAQLPLKPFVFKILVLYVPPVLTYFLLSISAFMWRQRFCQQFEFFLNTLIAQIKMGASLPTGFKQALPSLNPSYKSYFTEILEEILFSKNLRDIFCFSPVKNMIIELKKADKSSHCLKHLENLRHQVKIRSLFRRKAEATLLQIRIQSLTLLILYICLFIFVLTRYGLKYGNMLLISALLFAMGLFILFHCGRKIKWTI